MHAGQITKVKTEVAPSRGIKVNAEMAVTGKKRTGWNQLSQSKIHCTNNSLWTLTITSELVSLLFFWPMGHSLHSSQWPCIIYFEKKQSIRKNEYQTVDTVSHSAPWLNLVPTWRDCVVGSTPLNSFPLQRFLPVPICYAPPARVPLSSLYASVDPAPTCFCQPLSAPRSCLCSWPKTH